MVSQGRLKKPRNQKSNWIQVHIRILIKPLRQLNYHVDGRLRFRKVTRGSVSVQWITIHNCTSLSWPMLHYTCMYMDCETETMKVYPTTRGRLRGTFLASSENLCTKYSSAFTEIGNVMRLVNGMWWMFLCNIYFAP